VKHSQQPQPQPLTSSSATAMPPSSPAAGSSSSPTAGPSSSRQMLPLQPSTIPATLPSGRDRPSVNQHEEVVSGSHSRHPTSRNADLGQRESHTNAAGIPDRIVNGLDDTQGQTSRGSAGQRILRRRGRSPRRHGTEKLELAVSARHFKSPLVFLC
jgi:hypothetical protein